MIWKYQNSSCSWQNYFIYWAILTYSRSGTLYWMKQLFINKTESVKKGWSLSNDHSPIVLGRKLSLDYYRIREDLFLSASFCWDSRLSLREMDQKIIFCGTISYGDSYLEVLFRLFKVFRLRTILDDAAGAVGAHSGKNPDYCCMVGRGPNSCLFGNVTRLLLCLYVKLFLHSIFISVDFWSSMSCIVIGIELTDIKGNMELGVVIDGSVQGYSSRPPRMYKPP